jgi:hypothetical protein
LHTFFSFLFETCFIGTSTYTLVYIWEKNIKLDKLALNDWEKNYYASSTIEKERIIVNIGEVQDKWKRKRSLCNFNNKRLICKSNFNKL